MSPTVCYEDAEGQVPTPSKEARSKSKVKDRVVIGNFEENGEITKVETWALNMLTYEGIGMGRKKRKFAE